MTARLILAIGVILLLGPAAASAQTSEADRPDARTITVTGTGEASAKPDQAISNFTVLRSAGTARAALDQVNQAMTKLINGMKEMGIESRDLQTAGFSVTPQYRADNDPQGNSQEPPKIVAYEVRNTLSVKMRDLAKVGEILDQAITLGVNQGGDISFTIADPDGVHNEARRDAVADAMATAKLLADAAGALLGPVREISEGSFSPFPPVPAPYMKIMAADSRQSVPVETGENTVNATVTMVFDLGG